MSSHLAGLSGVHLTFHKNPADDWTLLLSYFRYVGFVDGDVILYIPYMFGRECAYCLSHVGRACLRFSQRLNAVLRCVFVSSLRILC